jgi:Tol biopolymer transport system component
VTPGRIRSFDLSPDGTRMLMTADGSGRPQPWIVPLDGSQPRLAAIDGAVQRCVWTPDGARFIALVDPDGREDNQVAVVDVATGAVELIAAQPGYAPSSARRTRQEATRAARTAAGWRSRPTGGPLTVSTSSSATWRRERRGRC